MYRFMYMCMNVHVYIYIHMYVCEGRGIAWPSVFLIEKIL